MTTKPYTAQYHIFDNDNGDDVYILPKEGKTLHISGSTSSATDKEVVYNNSGTLVGSPEFTYDYDTEVLQLKKIAGVKMSNDLGYNQLQLVNSSLVYTPSANTAEQGYSLAISNANGWLAVGAPKFVPGASTGGECMFNSFVPSALLTCVTATLDAYNGHYSDINGDGTRVVFCDKSFASNGSLSTYSRSGSTWSSTGAIIGGVSCKISDVYILSGDYGSIVTIYFWNGSAWTTQQTLQAVIAGGSLISALDIVNSDTACYYRSGAIYVWKRVLTTWTNTQIIVSATMTTINLSVYIMACCSTSTLYIYERADLASNFILSFSLAIADIIDVCCNTTYVFALTATKIYIFHKVSGTWTKSDNETNTTGAFKIGCNASYVVVGQPSLLTNGQVSYYTINEYTNTLTEISSIVMNQASNNLEVNSIGQIDVTAEIVSTAPITCTDIDATTGVIDTLSSVDMTATTTTSGKVLLSAGSVASPSLTFSVDDNLGIYRVGADSIGITNNGVQTARINTTNLITTNPILAPLATVSAPSYSFTGDTDTGMWSSGPNSLDFTLGGVNKVQMNTTNLVCPTISCSDDGSVTAPSYTFSSSSTTKGMYSASGSLNFACGGRRKLFLWDDGVPTIPGRIACGINRSSAISTNVVGTSLGIGSTYPQSCLETISDSNLVHNTMIFYNNTNQLCGNISTGPGAIVSFNSVSDETVKENITPAKSSLDKINNVCVKNYKLKTDCTNTCRTGVLAQEFKEIFPELVQVQEDGLHLVDYYNVIPHLLNAVKELSAKVQSLDSELLQLGTDFDALVDKINNPV